MSKPIKKLKFSKNAYSGEACIIEDPRLGEQYIVVARDSGVLQRVLTRVAIELELNSKQNRKVIITPE